MKELILLLETNGAAALCILITIYILFRVFTFVWQIKKEKDKLSEESVKKLAQAMEQNTAELHELRAQIQSLESTFAEFPKFKLDMRRLFFAVKSIAGEKWPAIRAEMMQETDFLER